jgi:RNA polymerase sigma-70 factor (ECF subfamily)
MYLETTAISSTQDLAQLLSKVALSDRVAFATLYGQTRAQLYGVVSGILSRSDLAGDILQEIYMGIWRKAGKFDASKGSPMAWMSTMARNQALDEVRRVKPLAFEDMPNFEPAAEDFDPLGSRDRSERLRVLLRCLSELEPENRAIILLAYYRGASRKALSKRFGASVSTIKSRLRRSLAQLKGGLEQPSVDFVSATPRRPDRK